MTHTNPSDLLLAIKALARIQDAIGRHVRENPSLNKDQFIDEVLAAADDKEVVRTMKGLMEQAEVLGRMDGP